MTTKTLHNLSFVCLILIASHIQSFAQQTTEITGVVTDALTNDPIPFANVTLAGASVGTTTDERGNFKLIIDVGNSGKLIVSHINYHKAETGFSQKFIRLSLEPKEQQIDHVVVSATLTEQLIHKTTQPVNVIANRKVQDNINSNIVDMLSRTPGFTQVWEYHSPLLLRGMNSNRLLVLKNGSRRIGTFPGGYFGQDLNIYEAKKIEVIKGPGSVIYGSGAISGIINIITPTPLGGNTTNTKILSGYGSNNKELIEAVSFCNKTDKFGVNLHGKWRKTGEYSYANSQTALNSEVEDRDLSLTTGYKLSNKHQIAINADYHWGDWGKPRGFNGPEKYFTQIRNNEEGIHTALNYTYSPNGFIDRVVTNLYFDHGTRDYYQYKHSAITGKKTTLDLVHYKDNYGGGQAYTVLNASPSYKITTGIDGYMFRINSPTNYYDYYNNTEGYNKGYENAGQQSIGIFANNEWTASERLNITAGLRYDWATVVEGKHNDTLGRTENRTAISGNFGLVIAVTKQSFMSLNIGRAFRMPITEELFTETVSCKGIKKGNPTLKPEYSWNIDAGYRGSASNNNLNWDLALFYNIVDSYINEATDTLNENMDFTYKNTDAILMGGEASLSYRFNNVIKAENKLYAGLSASYVYGIDKSGNQSDAPLFGVPPLKLLADIKYQGSINKHWITGYHISIEGEYAASQNRIAPIPEGADSGPWGYETSDPHTAFNATMGLNSNALPGFPKLRFVVKNILNSNYKPYGSYIPVMGRNFKVLLSFTF